MKTTIVPPGYISPDVQLPDHRENIIVYTNYGREIDCIFKNHLFKVTWDVGFVEIKNAETVIGWKKIEPSDTDVINAMKEQILKANFTITPVVL